jgi:hypothetical protein
MSKPAIQLAPERHAQIKAISAALELSISEVIARFINDEIAAGTIPAGIEGLNIHRDGDTLLVGFDDQPPVRFSREGVTNLSTILREFADAKKPAEKVANMRHDYMIERKGNGVKLTVPLSGSVTKSWSRDLARDAADLLAS